jgi:hypothetical protein
MCKNDQGVDASRKLFRQGLVDHSMPLDPGFPFESHSSDKDTEVCFSLRPAADVTGMLVAFIDDLKFARRELPLQLCVNSPTPFAKLNFAAHGFVNSLEAHYVVSEAIHVAVFASLGHDDSRMKLESKYFDSIRVKPDQDRRQRARHPVCAWPGCSSAGTHRAPRGRQFEGQYLDLCLDHVREYNKEYNFFKGLDDEAVSTIQKDALTGHRPTWRLGENSWASSKSSKKRASGGFRPNMHHHDPFGLLGEPNSRPSTPPSRTIRNAERKALHSLGLEEGATSEEVKMRYKSLVKRLHPDANGGSRENEDKLKEVIQAYDYLRSAGFC